MKTVLIAIYNTLQKLNIPLTPENAKYMAGIFLKLEELIEDESKRELEKTNLTE